MGAHGERRLQRRLSALTAADKAPAWASSGLSVHLHLLGGCGWALGYGSEGPAADSPLGLW